MEDESATPPHRPPLSTIDSSRTVPRSAKLDGIATSLKADINEDGEDVRDKCVIMIYDALAGDSTAGDLLGPGSCMLGKGEWSGKLDERLMIV